VRLGIAVLAGLAVALGAAALAAAAAPSAVTGAVTGFGTSSATVTGTVNPNGEATTWFFEYGKNTGYGSQTGSASAGSGTTSASVSTTVTGLSPGTTYHYRFVAMNGSGTTRGGDGVFTTAAAPAPEAVTGTASGVSTTSAALNGSVNPNGTPTTWYFDYGPSTGYGSKTPAQNAGSGSSAVNVSAPVAGLQTGRVYHFRLVAASDAGTTRGADQTFSTVGAPSVSTAPASSISSSGARLNGAVNPQGRQTNWHFEYGTTTGYGSSTPSRSAGSGTSTTNVSASISGLAAGVTYHFRIVATNGSGTTASGDETFTTVGGPVAQTSAAQGIGTTTASLNGSVDPRGRTTSWYFEYGTSTRYGSRTPTRTDSAGSGNHAVTAGISGLTAATTYHFRLVATSSGGTSRGADASFTTLGGVTLTHVGVVVVYGHGITLSGVSNAGQTGLQVTVLAQKYGDASFATVAGVLTGAGGRWSYLARPTIRTTYVASANGVSGPATTIGVRPAVSLVVGGRGRVSTRVRAGTSFAGRFVQLQRRSGGRWVTVKRARLNGTSAASFAADVLPRGPSTIRIAMSVNQAGAGYLGGFSRTAAYRR
jgi:hypothetical protein